MKPPSIQPVLRTVSAPDLRIRMLNPGTIGNPLGKHPSLVQPQRHKNYELAIGYEGESMMVSGARIHILKPGDALIIMPGAWHYESYHRARQSYRLCWLIAEGTFISCILTHYHQQRFDHFSRGRIMTEGRTNPLAELAREANERKPHWRLKVSSLLMELMVDLQRSADGGGPLSSAEEVNPIQKALRIMETRFREPVQIKTMARQVGLSPNYLSHRIRQVNGMTFKRYLNSIRIHHAQLLLRSGSSLKDTAGRTGFENVYYFSRVFSRLAKFHPEGLQNTFAQNKGNRVPGERK